MAFVQITRHRRSHGEVGDTVAMGLYAADGKHLRTRSIVFFVSRPVIAKLGWELDDNQRIRVTVHEGVGSDQGFLLVVPGDLGYTATPGNKATARTPFRFNVMANKLNHYTLNDTQVDTAPVQYVIDGNSLIIECPDWLRFNPLTAPPEPEPAPAPEPMALPAFPETRVSTSTPQPHVLPKRRGRPPKGGHRYS